MSTLNLIRKIYIPFVLKVLQEPKSMQETVQQSGVERIIPKKKKNYLKYNIGLWIPNQIWLGLWIPNQI